MKKFLIISAIVCLALSFSAISYASVDSIYEAAVVNVTGDVKVDTRADGTWITPWVGMKLMEGAIIKTGDNSSADIVYDAEGLNVLTLNPNTQLTVEESMADLSKGTVVGDFANIAAGSTFTVKTPTAACGIRGTVFRVTLTSGREVRVELVNGNMTVQPLDAAGNPVGAPVTVPQSYQVTVASDGTVSEPTALTAEQIGQIEDIAAGAYGTTTEEVEEVTVEEPEPDPKDLEEDKVKKEEEEPCVSPSC